MVGYGGGVVRGAGSYWMLVLMVTISVLILLCFAISYWSSISIIIDSYWSFISIIIDII
jgi:hypothetical protein